MTEESNNPLDGLSKPWQKFFNKFDEIKELRVSQWKDVHILAYICDRYEKHYAMKFSVSIKGAPTKSPDMYMIKKIKASLNTTDNAIIKEYIDWTFDTIIIPKKYKLKKIGFFITAGFINEFFFYRKNKKNNITRSTPVPETYKNIANEIGIDINTYGDLAFICMAIEAGSSSEDHNCLIGNLELLGLDTEKLKVMK